MSDFTPWYIVTHTAKGLLLQGKQGRKTELFLDNISRLVLEGYNIRFDAAVKWAYAYEHKRLSETIASMQGEAVSYARPDDVDMKSYPDLAYNYPVTSKKFGEFTQPLFTYPPSAASKIAEQEARIKELEQQLEEARKDAERYRWMRSGGKDLGGEVIIYGYSPKGLDESIDAAIRQIGGAE